MKAFIGIFGVLALLAGCGGNDYAKYLDAQAAMAAANPPRPLFILEAHEGQTITGIKRLEVNAQQVGQGQASLAPPPRNEWLGIVSQSLGIVGAVGGVLAGGKAAEGLARAVGNAATVGYSHVQAPPVSQTIVPQANVTNTTTTTLSGTGAIGGNSTPTTQTLSGTGALGGDYTHTPSTTTTSDSHAISSAYNPVTSYPQAK